VSFSFASGVFVFLYGILQRTFDVVLSVMTLNHQVEREVDTSCSVYHVDEPSTIF
jgi:hypothetical protein